MGVLKSFWYKTADNSVRSDKEVREAYSNEFMAGNNLDGVSFDEWIEKKKNNYELNRLDRELAERLGDLKESLGKKYAEVFLGDFYEIQNIFEQLERDFHFYRFNITEDVQEAMDYNFNNGLPVEEWKKVNEKYQEKENERNEAV